MSGYIISIIGMTMSELKYKIYNIEKIKQFYNNNWL
jgi:hypothetical protein